MKITKIPGLGRFGVFIDDVDLYNITDEEWAEIGKIHLQSLVTVIRGNDLDHATYYKLFEKWGHMRWNRPIALYQKYGKSLRELVLNDLLDETDKITMSNSRRWQVDKRYPGMVRITPRINTKGQSVGIFGDGELHWHSNECADPAFTPGVALMGVENMEGSATGFCTTVDWYEKQTESFRSELDEMRIIHNYRNQSVSYELKPDQEQFYKYNMCPADDMDMPMVIKNPGGLKGVHLGVNTFDHIVGMTKEESDKLFAKIRKEIFTEEYIYRHWYSSGKDICIFDNSITFHNRQLEMENAPLRLAYRLQFDYDKLTGETYTPFYQQEYNDRRAERLRILGLAMEGMHHVD